MSEQEVAIKLRRGQRMLMFLGILVACLFNCPDSSLLATDSNSSNGRVEGAVLTLRAGQTLPAPGVKVMLSTDGHQYEAFTDASGRYELSLPSNRYRELVYVSDYCWYRRASFRLQRGDQLTFDFLVMPGGSVDSESNEAPEAVPEEPKLTLPDTPLDQQVSRYQEQLFPAGGKRPEILVSFGKFDNRGQGIEYFPFEPKVVNRSSQPYFPRPLPVTITVDRYTIRALSVVLNKETLVFRARGNVSVSDGKRTVQTSSAVLSFPGGRPKIESK